MTHKVLIATCLWLFTHLVLAQGVGINTTNPNGSAALHINETNNMGLLIPVWNNKPSGSAAGGMMVYDAMNKHLYLSVNGEWRAMEPVPQGTIVMWSGTTPPSGWALCDGGVYTGVNGTSIPTPDLRGRFVVGQDSLEAEYVNLGLGNNSGRKNFTLTEANLPPHTHSISSDHGHSISLTGGDHTHEISTTDAAKEDFGTIPKVPSTYPGTVYNLQPMPKMTAPVETGVSVGGSVTGLSVNATGSGDVIENRPPYYTLAFIMKL